MRPRSLAVLLPLALAACSVFFDTAPAEQEVERFHRLLDEQSYDKLYSDTGDEFKAATKRDEFIAFVEAVHRKLGDVRESHKQGTHRTGGTGGTFVTLTYKTTFAEGPAQESFRFRMKDGRAVLLSYNVSSTLLVTR